MKRLLFMLALAMPLVTVYAQRNAQQGGATPFDSAVDFSVTVKSLAESAAKAPIGPLETVGSRAFILYGTVASIAKSVDGGWSVEVISGEWIGDRAVRLYRVFVTFDGAEFTAWFDKDSPDYCAPGTKLIIAASRPVVSVLGEDKARMATLAGLELRAVK